MSDQLFEKPLSPGDIITIKLANGDELLSKLVTLSDTVVTITKPLMMVVAQDARGNPGIQLLPFWMLGANKDGKLPINKSHIMCMVKANEEATNGYLQQTTGLTIPNSTRQSGLIT